MTDPAPADAAGPTLADDLRAVLPPWLTARVLVLLAWWVAPAVVRRSVPGGTTVALQQGLFAWDGAFYRDIAEQGYGALPAEALRFFPGYPLVGRLLGEVPGLGVPLALLLVANLASLAAAVVLRRLVRHEGRPAAEADRAAMFLALLPPAFVLVWAYAEGLFLAAAVVALWAARHRRWEVVVIAGLAAGLVRPTGALLAVPVAIEAARGLGATSWGERARRAAAVVAGPVGVAAYLLWVRVAFGDGLAPLTIQGELRGDANPIVRLGQGLIDMVGRERFGDGLHVPFVLLAVAAVVVLARRWPASYTALAVAVLVTALAADNLNSFERYALNGVPFVLAAATVTAAPRVERLALAASGCGLWALCTLAWLGVYVP